MPGGGRTFRRNNADLWTWWPFRPIVDEVYPVIFIDGLHLGRKAVILIAPNNTHVLGWYVARSENANAWGALMARIAAPEMVVCDGGSGVQRALREHWPTSVVQRCTFHVWTNIITATTRNPRLEAAQELKALGASLIQIKDAKARDEWIDHYANWSRKWAQFLAEKTELSNGSQDFTHRHLVKARNQIRNLSRSGHLFSFLDPAWQQQMPAMNNKIEGATNSPLRELLRTHRGMSLTHRIKAVFWWCYLHSENPLPAAQIITTMPTDADIDAAYQRLQHLHTSMQDIPGWGHGLVWAELHHATNPWD